MRPHRLLFALLLGSAATLPAQSLFGTVLGRVTDPSGAKIPAAAVTIRNTDTNLARSTVTNSSGDFELPSLTVGNYELRCESKGFKTAIVKGLVLQVDQRLRADVDLEVGDVLQSIEVAGTARLIETDTATEGTVIDNQRVVRLPLNGRNFQQLATLGPGALAPLPGSGPYTSIGGTHGLGTSFLLDGVTDSNTNANTALISPSVELIQEFKVLRNTFNAEFGHGASQINVVTRTGSNEVHLTLFEFLRNDQLQARNFFDPTRKPALRKNQFGGTVSGPVSIPKLYSGKNRTFFLFNYEGVRERDPATIFATVPTQSQLNGDLSGMKQAIDPLTKAPFAGNQIPQSRMDSASKNFLKYMPVTDAPLGSVGTGLNILRTDSARSGFDQFTARGDQNFGAAVNLFGRYTINDNQSYPVALIPYNANAALSRQQSAVLGLNWVIRPDLINESRLGFGRHNLHSLPLAATVFKQKLADEIGIHNLLSSVISTANALPSVAITGFSGTGGGGLITQRVNTFSFVDNLSWIRGSHTVKAGFDIRRMLHDTRNIGTTQGAFSFTGAFSGVPLGDFLLGIPQTAGGTAPPGADGVNLTNLWQGFVQDDWKVGRDLTVSYGLRYEYLAPWVNNRNHISRFDPTFPGGRLIYPGDAFYFVPGQGFIPTDHPLASPGLYAPDRKDFCPRFGFAWRPFGSNHSSVRGSYGIFIDNSNETNNIFSIANPPHVLKYSITNDLNSTSLIPWSSMFPAPDAVALSIGVSAINSVAPTMRSGYIQQWSFNFERELGHNLALELGYMGAKGTALDERQNWNQAVLDPLGKRTSIQSRLPFPVWAAGLVATTRNGFSNYHSFISRLEKRFSSGISFLAAYTFSKSIDDVSFSGNIGAQPAQAQNAYDQHSEKGLSYFDVPHRVVGSFVWELPFGHGRRFLSRGSKALDYVAGGWSFSGIAQYQSGNPWSILLSNDVANVGTTGQRADLVGNPFPAGFERGGTARLALNRAAFAIPQAGTFGNSGRNIIRDASLANADVLLQKDIPIRERSRLEFRAEFFNALNHTQFMQFANTINSPTFGTWNSARDPRIVQFGLKLHY